MSEITKVIAAVRAHAWFLAEHELQVLATHKKWRLAPVLVRLQDGPRFTANARDVDELLRVMEKAGYVVRDICLQGSPAPDEDDIVRALFGDEAVDV